MLLPFFGHDCFLPGAKCKGRQNNQRFAKLAFAKAVSAYGGGDETFPGISVCPA
jgi:hypothetical protein